MDGCVWFLTMYLSVSKPPLEISKTFRRIIWGVRQILHQKGSPRSLGSWQNKLSILGRRFPKTLDIRLPFLTVYGNVSTSPDKLSVCFILWKLFSMWAMIIRMHFVWIFPLGYVLGTFSELLARRLHHLIKLNSEGLEIDEAWDHWVRKPPYKRRRDEDGITGVEDWKCLTERLTCKIDDVITAKGISTLHLIKEKYKYYKE